MRVKRVSPWELSSFDYCYCSFEFLFPLVLTQFSNNKTHNKNSSIVGQVLTFSPNCRNTPPVPEFRKKIFGYPETTSSKDRGRRTFSPFSKGWNKISRWSCNSNKLIFRVILIELDKLYIFFLSRYIARVSTAKNHEY